MANFPNFASTPRANQSQISTANTARDGSGTLVDIVVAGASGTRIDQIKIKATGTTTAGMIRLFISDGTTNRLWKEIAVAAITPSGTVQSWESNDADLRTPAGDGTPLLALPSGYRLKAAPHNAETFNVLVTSGADF